ncbi:MAG: carbamoyltransferase HypF [Myxococcota bacterium]|nr:carbamoyltransferase HypF [Myxococcota bacterium]
MDRVRRELRLRGVVQGVGFRPWAAQRARELGVAGAVRNTGSGVEVALEGEPVAVARWIESLRERPPHGAQLERLDCVAGAPRGVAGFSIEPSAPARDGLPRIPPDVATCRACVEELFEPAGRRHRYAFTHCAACGPRAAVLDALPYDRARTALAPFPACAACRREYDDPDDRRHHAQTIACPRCGPQLRARDPRGEPVSGDPVARAAEALAAGAVVALLGYGGFHLAVDATRSSAVARLRARKDRPTRPFAVLVPDLATARSLAHLEAADEALLSGPPHAVVVAPARSDPAFALAHEVAPATADVGLVLPVAPLHWLLLWGPGTRPGRDAPRFRALVLTSANRSGEPTLTSEPAAWPVLARLSDLVVDHDRCVRRPNDDPVFRSAPGGPIPLRLSRASAPRAFRLPPGLRAPEPLAAVGGDLKSAPAIAVDDEVVLAEHVGDLGSEACVEALEARLHGLARLLGVEPHVVVHDAHPDSAGAWLAARIAPRVLPVGHHHAHAMACLVEHGVAGPALALALDGLGLGPEGELWGGELLHVDARQAHRIAHLEPIPLAGGDAAARQPWRVAAAWLARAFPSGDAPPLPWHTRRDLQQLERLAAVLRSPRLAPPSSSCGRLFDAVASLLDVADAVSHEGEAAMGLESLAAQAGPGARRHLPGPTAGGPCIPLGDLLRALVLARAAGAPRAELARAFHERLAERLAAAAIRAARAAELERVALCGGCFQNRLLLESVGGLLRAAGLQPLRPLHLPPSDAGLAVGQAAIAAAWLAAQAGDPPRIRRSNSSA